MKVKFLAGVLLFDIIQQMETKKIRVQVYLNKNL